ncbi:MAG: DUF493 domain-containing protein [Pseudomonadota bacterium]
MTSATDSGAGGERRNAAAKIEEGRGLEFPCTYPIKAMGKSGAGLTEQVLEIVSRHVAVEDDAVRSRPSKGGKYESITVTVQVESREQLEAIYGELTRHDQVLWTL